MPLLAAFLALAISGCAARVGPRPIVTGTPCAACGMRIQDLRYACEAEREGALRVYDSIECLLRAGPAPARAWLADYDTRTLHVADSCWVVQADIPSPMGGGYAAFLDPAVAGEIASSRNGRIGRLGDFASGGAERDSTAMRGSAVGRDSAARRP
jgi:nitrous oxide reductase accessory protein NosL